MIKMTYGEGGGVVSGGWPHDNDDNDDSDNGRPYQPVFLRERDKKQGKAGK